MSVPKAVALGLACLVGSCGRSLTQPECDALLDRYVEKLVASDRPGTSGGELVELQKKTRAAAGRDPAFAACQKEVSRKKFECAMDAPTVDRMEICLM